MVGQNGPAQLIIKGGKSAHLEQWWKRIWKNKSQGKSWLLRKKKLTRENHPDHQGAKAKT